MMKHATTGLGILLAFLAVTGLAAAQPLALVTGDGGGQAQGQAHGDYYVDAAGAVDEGEERHDEISEQTRAQAKATSEAYEETKWRTYENASDVERPQEPQCDCDEVVGEVEQAGTMQAEHTDHVEKAADVESEYVDAGADVGASGQAKAWFSNLFEGTEELYNRAKGLMGYETQADQEAKVVAEQTLETEDELRGQVVDRAMAERDLPDADPRVDGQLDAQHATEVTSEAVGNAEAGIP